MSGQNRLVGKVARQAELMLPKVAKILEEAGIPYCLDGGTLLGLVREGRLLPWDDDLDFFVRGVDADRIRALRWNLLRAGCRLSMRYVSQDHGPIKNGSARIFKIKALRKHNGQRAIIDLIFKYDDAEHYHWVVGVNPSVHKKVPRRFYDAFDDLTFADRSYPTPCDVETYLEHRYGDWRTPKKEWDFRTDDQALAKN